MLKTITLQRINKTKLTHFFSLTIVAIMLPIFVHNQIITGSIINAILILSTVLIGIRSAVLISLFPSVIALSSGLLPAMLAPVVPFIMIGNILLVITFDFFWNNSENKKIAYISGIIFGAIFKFLFLYLSVNIIVKLLVKQELIVKVAKMMSLMQLTTALVGGVLALIILKMFKKF